MAVRLLQPPVPHIRVESYIFIYNMHSAGTTLSQSYNVVLVHCYMTRRTCLWYLFPHMPAAIYWNNRNNFFIVIGQWVDELSVGIPCTEGSKCPCLHYKYNTKKAVLLSSAKRIELHKLSNRLCFVRVACHYPASRCTKAGLCCMHTMCMYMRRSS